jgi:hypothetical protein
LSRKKEGEDGVVINMEVRRRSGRGVVENFVVILPSATSSSSSLKGAALSDVILLDDHPLYSSTPSGLGAAGGSGQGEEEVETTFNLGLTEKQKPTSMHRGRVGLQVQVKEEESYTIWAPRIERISTMKRMKSKFRRRILEQGIFHSLTLGRSHPNHIRSRAQLSIILQR